LLEAIMVPATTTIDDVAASVVMERPNLQMHAAPDGTVSILFSDIENSTMMTERLGDLRAQQVLHDHNDIIRKHVAEQKGFEVKSMGDGFMVAFSSARRALLCAIGIQRAFEDYSRQHPAEPIRVRIGLHMGEAISEGGDFFGKTVIMAARIGAKANAGEILVSSVFKAVTESAGDLRFDDGYEVELKGLSGTYRVHRVLWANGADTGSAHGAEPTRSTFMTAARRTTENPAPGAGGNRWPIAGGLGALLLVGGVVAYRLIPHGKQAGAVPAAAASAVAQPAPAPPTNQVAAVAVPQPVAAASVANDKPIAAAPMPNAVRAIPAPPPIDNPHVLINAPGISAERRLKALKTVSNWLNLRDEGKYLKAWNDSTFLLPRPAWIQSQEMLYARRGNVTSRKLQAEELSPARNPERMLFRYTTRFEKGDPVTELVYAIPQPNGQWVVSGYFVKSESEDLSPLTERPGLNRLR